MKLGLDGAPPYNCVPPVTEPPVNVPATVSPPAGVFVIFPNRSVTRFGSSIILMFSLPAKMFITLLALCGFTITDNCTKYGVSEPYKNTFIGLSYFDNIRYIFDSPVILKEKDTKSVIESVLTTK